MLPATGALIEGEGPGDGCSRATRDFIGMLRVLESVVRHPTGFVCLFKVNIGDSTPEPAASVGPVRDRKVYYKTTTNRGKR